MSLASKLQDALRKRAGQVDAWTAEGTDSYRLFHGAVEGRPGLSVDRYGPLTLAQVAGSSPLTPVEDSELQAFLAGQVDGGPAAVAIRDGANLVLRWESLEGFWGSTFWARELGLEFAIDLSKARRDLQLFLDFRAAKRSLVEALATMGKDASVLNLFAYTCSISCHSVKAGVREVWSADFSAGNLAWGVKNFRRNKLASADADFLEHDCVGLLWALTGNQKALSRRRGLAPRVQPRRFTVVVVDPPAFSKGKFATVDLVRDPETVFGPAWDVVAPGGLLVAANNSAKVTRTEFGDRLARMFDKRGAQSGACRLIEWVKPDSDFPSLDGEHPLKVAFCYKV